MTVRSHFGVCVLLGCSLGITGCAQPSLWSQFSGSKVLGSPGYRGAPAAPAGAPNRTAQKTPVDASELDSFTATPNDTPQPRAAAKASPVKSPFSLGTSGASKKDANGNDKGPTEFSQMSLARLHEKKNHPAEAETLYVEVLRRNPKNGVAWHRLGVISAGKGKFSDADKCFAKAEELAGMNSELLNDKGYSLYLQQRLKEAEDCLRQAAQMDRENVGALNNLGLVLGAQERFDEALTCFKKAGTDAEAYANLAYVYTQLGELEHAEAHYSHALTLDKNLKSAANAMVQVHEKRRSLAMKGPPTSLAEMPNLEGDSNADLAQEGAKTNLAKPTDAEVAAVGEPLTQLPVKLNSEPADAQVARSARRNDLAGPSEIHEEEMPGAIGPAAPQSLKMADLTPMKPVAKPSLPVARTITEDRAALTPVRHEQGEDLAARPEAMRAVKVEEVGDDDALPPVVTPSQYKVRRTSAELPVAPRATTPAPKAAPFEYGAPAERTSPPRLMNDLFPAP